MIDATQYPWDEFLCAWSIEMSNNQDFMEDWRSGELFYYENEGADRARPGAPDPDWLGFPGATDDEIAAAERRLGVTFPPSYRQFLTVSNGWRGLTLCVDHLYSTREVDWLRSLDYDHMTFNRDNGLDEGSDAQYRDYDDKTGEAIYPLNRAEFYEGLLAISVPKAGLGDRWLLNPQVISEDGEWEAWHDHGQEWAANRYRSFWHLVQNSCLEDRVFRAEEAGVARPDELTELDVAPRPIALVELRGPRELYADSLLAERRKDASVLAIGCGDGGSEAARLAEKYRLTVVDISSQAIASARRRAPAATYINGAIQDIDLPDGTFDMVCSYHALTYLSLHDQMTACEKIARWLTPQGHFTLTLGARSDDPETEALLQREIVADNVYRTSTLPLTHQLVSRVGLRPSGGIPETVIVAGETRLFWCFFGTR